MRLPDDQADDLDRAWVAGGACPWEKREGLFDAEQDLQASCFNNLPPARRVPELDLTSMGGVRRALSSNDAEDEQGHYILRNKLIAHFMYRRQHGALGTAVPPIQWPVRPSA